DGQASRVPARLDYSNHMKQLRGGPQPPEEGADSQGAWKPREAVLSSRKAAPRVFSEPARRYSCRPPHLHGENECMSLCMISGLWMIEDGDCCELGGAVVHPN